jgi:hypothetical protein
MTMSVGPVSCVSQLQCVLRCGRFLSIVALIELMMMCLVVVAVLDLCCVGTGEWWCPGCRESTIRTIHLRVALSLVCAFYL